MADENSNLDEPEWLSSQDAEMAAAMRAARVSFWEFARNVEMERWRILPAIEAALVKGYFEDSENPGKGEFQFVDDVIVTPAAVIGRLNSVGHDSAGQRVILPIHDVCDWFLVVGGNIHKGGIGGFTVDVLRKRVRPEGRETYESVPPVSWYRHRQGITAQDELDQVPVCKQCGEKDLFDASYRGGKCGVCANGLTRIQCERCSLPIIRSPEQPKLCHICHGKLTKSGSTASNQKLGSGSLLSKIYSGGVIFIIVLISLMLGMMIFDPAGAQAAGRTTMIGMGGILWSVLVGTLISNLRQKRLGMVATIVQIGVLVISCIGIPVALLGAVALAQQNSNR